MIVHGKGVWHKAETVQMTVPNNSELGTVVMHNEIQKATGKTTSLPVELVTIDQLVGELKLPSVDSIKMDIEGAERNALAGGASTLRRFKPRLAIAGYHLADDPEAIANAVKAAGVNYARRPCHCMIVFGRVMPETLFYEPIWTD